MKRKSTVIIRDPYTEWFSRGNKDAEPIVLHVRGYATIDGQYLEEQDLLDRIWDRCCQGNIATIREALKRLIPFMDGGWALVVQWPDGAILAATDRVRSIPLFYATTPKEFILSATMEAVQERADLYKVGTLPAFEFLTAGFVTGDETLYEDLHQIQAGEIIEFDPDRSDCQVRTTRYYRYFPREHTGETESQLKDRLLSVFDGIYSTFVRRNSQGTIIIPLSGGLDSRLTAAMLKKHGAENVICFSYGRPGNEESEISRQVAATLKYEWRFVEYTPEMWARWTISPETSRYAAYTSKGVSNPIWNATPAVAEMMSNYDYSEKPTFWPGHSTEVPAGSHIPENYRALERGKISVAQEMIRQHYRLWPIKIRSKQNHLATLLAEKIERVSATPIGQGNDDPAARCEMWDVENRQSLLIVNTVRAYEFFGARWRTCWDYPFTDFFLTVPREHRLGKSLYVKTLRDLVFTDQAAGLRELPLAGIGAWGRGPTKKSLVGRTKENVRNTGKDFLRATGMLDTVQDLFWKRRILPLLPQMWFANGRDPKHMTVAEAMKPHKTLEKLPADLLPYIEPLLKRRLDLRPHEGILSAIMLGELCQPEPHSCLV